MKYVLLENFVSHGTFEGTPGSDEHGNFIMFALNVANIILPGSFLKSPNGDMIWLKEQNYVKDPDNRITACKYYY